MVFGKNFLNILVLVLTLLLLCTNSNSEEEEIYLKAISDQIQVITKDLKTLEKAVYQKSDISNLNNLNSIKSDGLNEDILTKHLLKLNEIEDQFRELTNKFEEVNFKLDKLSSRVTKIQSDTQLRFSDIESGTINLSKENQVNLPGTSKPQDFGANPGYQTSNLPKEQTINSVETAKTVITEEAEKKSLLPVIALWSISLHIFTDKLAVKFTGHALTLYSVTSASEGATYCSC